MGIKAKNLIILFKFIRTFTIFLALVYLLTCVFQFYSKNIFIFLNNIFGMFPFIIKNLFNTEFYIAQKYINISYIYASFIMIVFSLIIKKILFYLEKLQKIEENSELKKRYLAQKELKIKKEKRKQIIITRRNMFFGLLEFKIDYFNYFGKFKSEYKELQKLNTEYCKMIANKLKQKYSYKIKILSANKLYFICNDFSIFSSINKDIAKLYKIFLNIGNKKDIKTEIILSYWAGDKNTNLKETYNILSKINELNYINQIVVASGVYFRYKDEHEENEFEFDPIGASKLINALPNGEDLDINLYIIKKKLFNASFP